MQRLSRVKATYTIAGTMIGAGILALPTAMADSGILPGVIAIIIIGFVSVYTALCIVEVSFRVSGAYHFPSLVELFLGRKGMVVVFVGILIYVLGALTGYLAAGGNLIFELSGGRIPLPIGTVIYFTISSSIVFMGLYFVGFVETVVFMLMILLAGAIGLLSVPHIQPQLALQSDWASFPSIFGVVLFAFAGHVIIPSIASGMHHDKKGMIYSTYLGLFGPMVFYLLWCILFTMVIPKGSIDDIAPFSMTATLHQAKYYGQPATIPLGHLIGGTVITIGSVFALLSTFTSYLGLGISMSDCWDEVSHKYLASKQKRQLQSVKINNSAVKGISNHNNPLQNRAGILLTVIIPLILSLSNPTSFLSFIEIAGMYGGSLFAGIMPPLLVLAARKKGAGDSSFTAPGGNWLPILVITFFVAGVGYRTYLLF